MNLTQQDYLAFESGRMTQSQEVDFFQQLIDTGELETLSARYELRAKELLAQGLIFEGEPG